MNDASDSVSEDGEGDGGSYSTGLGTFGMRTSGPWLNRNVSSQLGNGPGLGRGLGLSRIDGAIPSDGAIKDSISAARPRTRVLYHRLTVVKPNIESSLDSNPMTVMMKKTKVDAGTTHHSTSRRTRSIWS